MEYLQEQATAANVKISGFKSCSAHPQIAEQALEKKEQQRDWREIPTEERKKG